MRIRLVMHAIICFSICAVLLLCCGSSGSSAVAHWLSSRVCRASSCAGDEIVRIATLPQMGCDDICGSARSACCERGWTTADACLGLLCQLVRENGAGRALAEVEDGSITDIRKGE